MCIRQSPTRRRRKSRPNHSYPYYAAGGKLCIFVGPRGGHSRLCLPAQRHRRFLDRQQRSTRGHPFTSFFGQDFQIITHFLSPDTNHNDAAPKPLLFGSATWQSSFESSKVWAQVLNGNSIPASASEPSCPNAGSIACLLLQSIGSQQGPTGGKILANTTFVQRLNTKGGSAPDDADGCGSADKVGNQRLVPYTADYYFFRADQ
ncbi:MAG: hypothetical protein DMG58_11105 [Acidobacteria bacterium]|nr:MAG: hypothetical protein DMG58_11105 [Acidobacteriota bacterium]